jgi:NADP-dependent 3-hydroxy acid dehydrogenase YdfG
MRSVLVARARDELENVAARINVEGGRAIAVPTDVSDRASLRALVAIATRTFGDVDVLVNNAGGDPPRANAAWTSSA